MNTDRLSSDRLKKQRAANASDAYGSKELKTMIKMYHIPSPDSRLIYFLKLHRSKLIRTLDEQFIPEVSLQLDAVDTLLDVKGGGI